MNRFEKYQFIDRSIDAKLSEIKELRQLALSIPTADPSREFVKGGEIVQSRFESIVDKVITLETELCGEIDELVAEREDMCAIIRRVEKVNPAWGLFLRYRYLEGLTYEEIAEKLNCTVRNVYNIRYQAVKEAEKEPE